MHPSQSSPSDHAIACAGFEFWWISDQHKLQVDDKLFHLASRSSRVCSLLSGLAAIAVQQPHISLVSSLVHFLFHFPQHYRPLQCTKYLENACCCQAGNVLSACSTYRWMQLQASNVPEGLPNVKNGLVLVGWQQGTMHRNKQLHALAAVPAHTGQAPGHIAMIEQRVHAAYVEPKRTCCKLCTKSIGGPSDWAGVSMMRGRPSSRGSAISRSKQPGPISPRPIF